MKFNSAVDSWFYLVIGAVLLTLLVTVIPQLWSGQVSHIFAIVIIGFSLGLPLWLLFSTYYQVSEDFVLVKSGPFSWRVRISEIQSAKRSRNILSSPALSLNRIELRYGQGKIIFVSPKDQQGFLLSIGHAN